MGLGVDNFLLFDLSDCLGLFNLLSLLIDFLKLLSKITGLIVKLLEFLISTIHQSLSISFSFALFLHILDNAAVNFGALGFRALLIDLVDFVTEHGNTTHHAHKRCN